MSSSNHEWLSRKEASAYLHGLGCPLSPGTLAHYATKKSKTKGPAFTRTAGKIIRYKKSDLTAWAERVTERVE